MKKNNYLNNNSVSNITVRIKTEKIREIIKNLKEQNKNITLGDVIVHAICKCIKEFREFNNNSEEVNLAYFINLGKGSRTVVIKKADEKNIEEISSEIKNFALKYIHGELSDSDSENRSFYITNLSSFNIYQAIPPIYENSTAMISIASEFDSMINLTISYDSRISDCQKAAKFLNSIKTMLE